MNTCTLWSGLSFASLLAAGALATSVAFAADVSNGAGDRHSGQIHTHRGHHAHTKTTANTTQDQGAAQSSGTGQPVGTAPAK